MSGPKAASLPSDPGNVSSACDAVVVREFVAVLRNSQKPDQHFQALASLRRVLSSQSKPPIQDAIDAGALPLLIGFLQSPPTVSVGTVAEYQLEAAWTLTNVVSGTSVQTAAMVELGGVEALLSVLDSPVALAHCELCEQCLWALGNIAGDCVGLRDHLLRRNAIGRLGGLYQQLPGVSWSALERAQVLRTLIWLMGNLCRSQPAPALAEVDCCFDFFVQVLMGTDDALMLSEALWGLSYLLEGASEDEGSTRAARFLAAGFGPGETPMPPAPHPVVERVVCCMKRPELKENQMPVPALRLLGALVSASSPELTDLVIAAGVLRALRDAVRCVEASTQVRCDAVWTLSNIAAGSPAQAQRLLIEPGVWAAVCDSLESGATHEIRRECAWTIVNVAKGGAVALTKLDCKALLRLLKVALQETKRQQRGAAAEEEKQALLLRALLDVAESCLRCGQEQAEKQGVSVNPFVRHAEECGLLDQLEELQHSESEAVYRKAVYLLESWFQADLENEPPGACPIQSKLAKGFANNGCNRSGIGPLVGRA